MSEYDLDLVATPANPIPAGATLHEVTTRDRQRLRAASWLPLEGEAQGVVTLLQGRGEFIEKYFETIADLRARGFHVVAFDWRGQGGSRPLKRHGAAGRRMRRVPVRDFAAYQRDLDAVMEQVVAPLGGPNFALCHSMGGTVALLRAEAGQRPRQDFTRIVAVSPMIALSRHTAPAFAGLLARLFAALGLGRLVVPRYRAAVRARRAAGDNAISHDPARLQRLRAVIERAPWIMSGGPTFGWLAAAYRAMGRLASPGFALRVATPTLIIAAGDDKVVSTPAIERFGSRLKTGNALVLPHARHEILIESDDYREVFWAAFDAFIPGKGLIGSEPPASVQAPSSASAAS